MAQTTLDQLLTAHNRWLEDRARRIADSPLAGGTRNDQRYAFGTLRILRLAAVYMLLIGSIAAGGLALLRPPQPGSASHPAISAFSEGLGDTVAAWENSLRRLD